MDILSRIHKNMYGLHILNEVTQFVNKDDQPNKRFDKLYNRIVSLYPDEKNLYQDFYNKLFKFLKQDQFVKFPISFFNKKEYPKLVNIIHKLDNVIAQINRLKGIKIEINPNINDIPKVYENKELGIVVYRADNVFQAIELGKGTNFCISVGLNGKNHYYEYKYHSYSETQKATMYFVHSYYQEDPNKILAIDIRSDGSFLYTNTDNADEWFTSYNQMVDDYMVSPDLRIIPKEVFKWVDQPINSLSDNELIEVIKNDFKMIQHITNPSDEIQVAAFKRSINNMAVNLFLKLIKNDVSEKLQLAIVENSGDSIQYLDDPSEAVQLAAVTQWAGALFDIPNPSEAVQLAAVNQNGRAIKLIENPSEAVQLVAINQNPSAIEFIENPTKKVKLAAAKKAKLTATT